jgi:hypothetical protein
VTHFECLLLPVYGGGRWPGFGLAGVRHMRQMRALRGSADTLEQRHNDPFRPPHVGHPPGAFVLADATDQPIPSVAAQSTAACRSLTSNDTLRNPSSLAIAAGEPGTKSGRTNLASSRRPPSPGALSMTISVRASGMPQTVSKNSPSTNALPHEERGHDIEICDRQADVVEASHK